MGTRHPITPVGFALLDERWSLDRVDTAETNATEHTPRPGGAVGSDPKSDLLPIVSGGQQSSIDLRVTKAGRPSVAPRGCGLAWKLAADAATEWRGHAGANWLHHWVPVDVSSSVTWDSSDCAVIPSSQKVIATRASTGGGSMGGRVWTPSTRTWSSTWTTGQVARGPVTICVVPGTERVLHLGFDQGGSFVPRVEYSDDAFTFAAYSRDPFPDGVPSGTLVRCRMRALGDAILLLVENSAGTLYQYASDDLGASFALVSSITNASECALAITPSGQALVGYISTSDSHPKVLTLGSAYDRIADQTAAEIAAVNGSALELVAEPDGTLWAYMLATATTMVRVWASTNDGASWTGADWGALRTGAARAPSQFAAAPSDGEILLLHDGKGGSGTSAYSGSLYCAVFGGWSNITNGHPALGSAPLTRTSLAYIGPNDDSLNWVGIASPVNMGWGATGAGSLVHNATTNAADFTTASTVAKWIQPSGTIPSAPDRCLFEAELTASVGGSTTTTGTVARVIVGDTSSYDYQAELRFATTGVQLTDLNGSDIGSALALDITSTPIQVLLYATKGTVAFYYRSPGDQNWTKHASGSLTNGGGAAPDVQVGHRVGIAGISESEWTHFGFAFDAYLAEAMSLTYVTGKALAGYPYPLARAGSTTNEAFLRCEGGTARLGATYDVPVDSDFPYRNVFPTTAPSKDDVWRSKDVITGHTISCDLSGADTLLGPSWCWVLFVAGSNTRQWSFRKKDDGAGSYTTIDTMDLATGFTGLGYALSGDVVAPNLASTSNASRYIQDNEFAGGFIVLDTGGTPKSRKILSHTAGGWTEETTVVPRFVLEGIDGTEAASGLCDIVAPQGVLVVPYADAAANLTRHISVSPVLGTTPDDYIQAGTIFVGAVMVPGKRWSRGWSYRYEPIVDREQDARGTLRQTQRGRNRRVFTWNHADGAKMDRVRAGVDLNYLSASGSTAALAARDDVLAQYVGMLDRTKGGELPVIMLAELPSSAETITDRTKYVYGLLSGSPQFGNAAGQLGTDAFIRGEQLTITEVV